MPIERDLGDLHVRPRVELAARARTAQVLVVRLAADHGGIVAAELERRDEQTDTSRIAGGLKITADAGVCRDAARHGILIEVVGWLLFVIVGLFFARMYIGMTNPKAEVLEMGTLYLRIVCTLSLGQFMSICFERMMQATGNTTLSMITQLSGAVTNIILDPILIFSCQMGIAGAAIATVIGQVVSCTVGFVLNQWKNRELRLTHEGFRFDWKTVQNILVVGIPSTIMQAISSVCTTLMNMILAGFGDIYVNVLGVYFKLQTFVFMPVFGLNQGALPVMGYNYGARKPERVKKTVKLSIFTAIGIMILGFAAFELIPDVLLELFDASETMLSIGTTALRIIGTHFLIAGINVVAMSVYQAVGNPLYSLLSSAMRQLVVLLPAAWLLARTGRLELVWLAFPIAELAALAMSTIFLRKTLRTAECRMADDDYGEVV